MRAWLSIEPGLPNTMRLESMPDPKPGPGQVLIEIRACGVNYFDYLIVQDLYQHKPPRPFSPGAEWAGVVRDVGEGITQFKPGDRVLSGGSSGGLAELAVASAAGCHLMPETMSFIDGAGYQTAFGTAYYCLRERGNLRKGETLLVLGAAGGMGAAAVQCGKAMGARVVAVVSTEEKAAFVRVQGADDVAIIPHDATDLRERLKKLCGPEGADVVYDPVGGPLADAAIRAIAFSGRYLIVGFTAGIPSFALNLPLIKHASVIGCRWGAFARARPKEGAALVKERDALYAKGALRSIVTETFPFERAPEAIDKLGERRGIGKIVIDFAQRP